MLENLFCISRNHRNRFYDNCLTILKIRFSMTLHYVSEHLGCGVYATKETSLFFLRDISAGETVTRNYLDYTLLVFLYDGEVEITYGIDGKLDLKAGNVFLLPKNLEINITAGKSDAKALLCKFNTDIKMCSMYSLKQLEKYIPENNEKRIYCLPFDERIDSFVNLVVMSLSDGLSCTHYHQIKREELFMYFRAGYTREELAMFFSPIIGMNIDFKDFVLTHYKQIYDVKEFAEKANMSQSTFNRRFKETFNDTALKWLLARKSESILSDIVKSDLTLSEISEKYRFSSPSYFVVFCKKHYGKTAAELRKERI